MDFAPAHCASPAKAQPTAASTQGPTFKARRQQGEGWHGADRSLPVLVWRRGHNGVWVWPFVFPPLPGTRAHTESVCNQTLAALSWREGRQRVRRGAGWGESRHLTGAGPEFALAWPHCYLMGSAASSQRPARCLPRMLPVPLAAHPGSRTKGAPHNGTAQRGHHHWEQQAGPVS